MLIVVVRFYGTGLVYMIVMQELAQPALQQVCPRPLLARPPPWTPLDPFLTSSRRTRSQNWQAAGG